MLDWVQYVNREIVVSRYPADCVVNIDQTNIDFDVASPTTLQSAGSRTVSVKITGSSDRCTVILGVTLSGRKLPAFVIYKGQPNGRIIREFKDPAFGYPQDMFYAVQPKAWDDVITHEQWINQVWLPYCRQQNDFTYLLFWTSSKYICKARSFGLLNNSAHNWNSFLGGTRVHSKSLIRVSINPSRIITGSSNSTGKLSTNTMRDQSNTKWHSGSGKLGRM